MLFFSKGFNCEKSCDIVAVLGMLKQNFSFLASYVIEAIQMTYFIENDKWTGRKHDPPGGGGGTSYKWANGDVPLDGVAFSRLD